ncbi:hypothetical protein DIE22_05075 [Burkholderia sp. Bp9142]|nr:hypothetical protein DIE22_05075 [Burkholderia sp. Bp9142]
MEPPNLSHANDRAVERYRALTENADPNHSDSRRCLADMACRSGACIDASPVGERNGFVSILSRCLDEAHVRAADVVALEGLSAAETLMAMVAAWRVEAIPFPVPHGMPIPYCDFVVTAGPRVAPGNGMPDHRGLAQTAMLHLTSGSTAHPRVVRRSVASVLIEAAGYERGLCLRRSDAVRVPVPVTHSFGSGVAVSSLLCGCHVLVDPVRIPSRLAAEVDAGGISTLVLTPPLARLVTETRPLGPPRLVTALVGAGTMTDELSRRFRERFGISPTFGYGSTETGGTFIGLAGIGNPIDAIDIVEPAPGSAGELVLRLPSPLSGYVGETPPSNREWRTGDLVDRTIGGVVHYVGRKAGPLRVNGRFVDIAPYEAALSALPDVQAVAFLALPGIVRPEIEELYAVAESRNLVAGQVIAVLDPLARSGVACRAFIVEQLPRNEVGKLDRRELVRMIRGGYT